MLTLSVNLRILSNLISPEWEGQNWNINHRLQCLPKIFYSGLSPPNHSLFFSHLTKKFFLKQFYLTWCNHFCQFFLPLFIYRCLSFFLNICCFFNHPFQTSKQASVIMDNYPPGSINKQFHFSSSNFLILYEAGQVFSTPGTEQIKRNIM